MLKTLAVELQDETGSLHRREADGELGCSFQPLGAEWYMLAVSGPLISKGDSELNNSFQWEPSKHIHAQIKGILLLKTSYYLH